jgi:hypothetical protein
VDQSKLVMKRIVFGILILETSIQPVAAIEMPEQTSREMKAILSSRLDDISGAGLDPGAFNNRDSWTQIALRLQVAIDTANPQHRIRIFVSSALANAPVSDREAPTGRIPGLIGQHAAMHGNATLGVGNVRLSLHEYLHLLERSTVVRVLVTDFGLLLDRTQEGTANGVQNDR